MAKIKYYYVKLPNSEHTIKYCYANGGISLDMIDTDNYVVDHNFFTAYGLQEAIERFIKGYCEEITKKFKEDLWLVEEGELHLP